MNNVVYKIELANKIRNGRAVGNLYGVGKYVNGCRQGYALEPQDSESKARDLVARIRNTNEP